MAASFAALLAAPAPPLFAQPPAGALFDQAFDRPLNGVVASDSGTMSTNLLPRPPAANRPQESGPGLRPVAASRTPATLAATQLPSFSLAEDAVPAAPPDRTPIRRSTVPDAVDGSPAAPGRSTGSTWIILAVIVTVIVGLGRWYRSRLPAASLLLQDDVLMPLGRRSVDPQSTIHFLRIGDRILVVGGTAEGLRTLTEIDDPTEVERLTVQCRAAAESGGGLRSILRRRTAEPVAPRLAEFPEPNSVTLRRPRERQPAGRGDG